MRRPLFALSAWSILAVAGAAIADDDPHTWQPPAAAADPGDDPSTGSAEPTEPAPTGSATEPAPTESEPAPTEPAPATPDPASELVAPMWPVEAPATAAARLTRPEVIEVTSAPVPPAGTIAVDARVARTTAGALGEPFRVLALLPGVTTSVAASGYPVIRGTLPGESRFLFDGIEVPLLYHLVLGTQVVHPSFIGGLELRAGGAGADHGHLLGGLITMTPASADQPRTELRANLVELGAFRTQPLSHATSIAVAARVGTIDGAAKLYDSDTTVHYVDQQTRLVHRLGTGDILTLTSLGAYDYAKLPPDPSVETLQLGFHRLDARWTRGTPGRQLRVGVQSELDSMRAVLEYRLEPGALMFPGGAPLPPPRRRGSRAYGGRAYADGDLRLTSALRVRGGVEAHYRKLDNREPLFEQIRRNDPLLRQASAVEREGAWTALELRLGALVITPGLRADSYHANVDGRVVRHASIDPRLAISTPLPGGGEVELAGGRYSAPPQVSVIERSVAIGPLPTTEGTGSMAGLSHGYQAQVSLRTPLPAGLAGNLAAYYRDTDYAIDFAMVDKPFSSRPACAPDFASDDIAAYRNVGIRAIGVEAMLRRELGRDVTGWVSYSLGKTDRDLGFVQLPHDFDQRHTLNATAQWRRGSWRFGASGVVHTGRPLLYPQVVACSDPDAPPIDVINDPSHLRRPAATWRVDLRAERAFELAGVHMRLSIELQNASLTREVTGYDVTATDPSDPSTYHATEKTLFLPLPMIGLEVDL
jgi:hypothetical protein